MVGAALYTMARLGGLVLTWVLKILKKAGVEEIAEHGSLMDWCRPTFSKLTFQGNVRGNIDGCISNSPVEKSEFPLLRDSCLRYI